MSKSILKVMMIIIDRNKTDKLLSKLEQIGINFPHVFRAEGTAKSDFLEVLGVGHVEKSIVFSFDTFPCSHCFSRLFFFLGGSGKNAGNGNRYHPSPFPNGA